MFSLIKQVFIVLLSLSKSSAQVAKVSEQKKMSAFKWRTMHD